MRPFNMSDEEKKELSEKHQNAVKAFREKQQAYKDGIKVPEKKEEKKKEK